MKQIGFLGLGKMGSAILNGILTNKLYKSSDIAFYAPSKETQEKYQAKGLCLVCDEATLFENSQIIIMAVKPQQYDTILKMVTNLDLSGRIIISLAPGKSISYLQSYLKGASIVRVMPNTPASIGKAVTTIAFGGDTKKEVLDIFSSIGTYVIVTEDKIDEAIPLNGSMPAFLLYFVKCFIENGIAHGISEADAKQLALHTIIGVCEMALTSEFDLDTLISNVCSKGGSTIEGLNALIDGGLSDIIEACYDACVARSKELQNV